MRRRGRRHECRRGTKEFVRHLRHGRSQFSIHGGEGVEDGLAHPDISLFVGDAAAVGLVVNPILVGAVVLALEFGFVAEPGSVRCAGGRAEGFDGEGLEVLAWNAHNGLPSGGLCARGAGVGVIGREGGDAAGESGLEGVAQTAETPFSVGHFAEETVPGQIVGREVSGEFGEEGVVLGRVVAGEEDGLGAEAEAEVVAGRSGFALV